MCQADFTGAGHASPTDHAGVADCVMRGAKGAGANQRANAVELAGNRIDAGDLERFTQARRGQNRRQGARHQSLAAAGRADHANVVAACTSDLKGALCVFLTADVLEIDGVDDLLLDAEVGRVLAGDLLLSGQMAHDVVEMGDGEDVDTFDEGGFGCVGLRNEEAAVAALLGHCGH